MYAYSPVLTALGLYFYHPSCGSAAIGLYATCGGLAFLLQFLCIDSSGGGVGSYWKKTKPVLVGFNLTAQSFMLASAFIGKHTDHSFVMVGVVGVVSAITFAVVEEVTRERRRSIWRKIFPTKK